MMARKSIMDFVLKGKEIHGDKYDYPSGQEYKNNSTKLIVTCKKCKKDFFTTFKTHINRGCGCPICGWERNADAKRSGYKKFLLKGKEIHGEKYEYPAEQAYKNFTTKLKVKCNNCKKHFSTDYGLHITKKRGCPVCGNARKGLLRLTTFAEFRRRLKEMYGVKYSCPPNQPYVDSRTSILVICDKHKQPFTTNYKRLITSGNGCKLCGYESAAKSRRKSFQTFLKEANETHNNAFTYGDNQLYLHNCSKIKAKCNIHGEFVTNYKEHVTKKRGCPKCGREIYFDRKRSNHAAEELRAKKILGDLYSYKEIENFTTRKKTIVEVTCKIHQQPFNITWPRHIRNYAGGCPGCKTGKIVKGELELINYLSKEQIKFIHQYKPEGLKFKRALSFDFYLPDYHTLLEFQGGQHYVPVNFFGGLPKFKQQRKRDKIKKDYTLKENLNFITLDEQDLKYLDRILLDRLDSFKKKLLSN